MVCYRYIGCLLPPYICFIQGKASGFNFDCMGTQPFTPTNLMFYVYFYVYLLLSFFLFTITKHIFITFLYNLPGCYTTREIGLPGKITKYL